MTREERNTLHKKQERLHVIKGYPRTKAMTNGVPEVRKTTEGVVEYVKHNNVLYKKILDKA